MSIGERGGAGQAPHEATAPHGSATSNRGAGQAAPGVTERAKDVASEAAHQTGDVIAQTREEISSLAHQARREAQGQLDAKGAEVGRHLRTLAGQLDALASGRTDEVGSLVERVRAAQSMAERLADRLDGPRSQGLVDDVTRYARRRPGTFLLAAMATGFAAGRIMRISAEASSGPSSTGTMPPPGSPRVAPGGATPTVGPMPGTVPA